jgi:DNA sulfur modification protein DndC
MEAMIDNGEEWLLPMLEIRDWLTSTQDPKKKSEIREHRRRTGRVEFFESRGKKKLRWGPYTLEFRKEILRRVLNAQKRVRNEGDNPELCLVRPEELQQIRQIWQFEEGDWEDSLPRIHEEVTGERLNWLEEDWSGMGGAEKDILENVCAEFELPVAMVSELFDIEREMHGMAKRAGIYNRIDKTLKKDWRTRSEALASIDSDDLDK